MSQLRVDEITDELGTGSPAFPNGVAASDLTGDVAAARITDALNATGSAPIYACRAWVNFDGTGTVAIRASGNISSITDNGTGDYTVNFATAMPDANYCCVASSQYLDDQLNLTPPGCLDRTTSNFRVDQEAQGGGQFDAESIDVAVFR